MIACGPKAGLQVGKIGNRLSLLNIDKLFKRLGMPEIQGRLRLLVVAVSGLRNSSNQVQLAKRR